MTYGELFTVQPFGNSLVVKTCTGAQIDALLEQQSSQPGHGSSGSCRSRTGSPTRGAAQAPLGDRIDPASIKLNGVTLSPDTGYRVTMNSFLASGGDGFTVFNQCTDALGGEIDLDALVRYFMQFGDGNPHRSPFRRARRTASRGCRSRVGTGSSGGFAPRIPRYTPRFR